MLWQLHNDWVVDAAGWDMVAPWPFQAPDYFLRGINLPALLVSVPISRFMHLETDASRYLVSIPVIVLLWWWIGTRIDFGLLPNPIPRWRKVWAAFLGMVAVPLLLPTIIVIGIWLEAFRTFVWLNLDELPATVMIACWGLWLFVSFLSALLAALQLRGINDRSADGTRR